MVETQATVSSAPPDSNAPEPRDENEDGASPTFASDLPILEAQYDFAHWHDYQRGIIPLDDAVTSADYYADYFATLGEDRLEWDPAEIEKPRNTYNRILRTENAEYKAGLLPVKTTEWLNEVLYYTRLGAGLSSPSRLVNRYSLKPMGTKWAFMCDKESDDDTVDWGGVAESRRDSDGKENFRGQQSSIRAIKENDIMMKVKDDADQELLSEDSSARPPATDLHHHTITDNHDYEYTAITTPRRWVNDTRYINISE